jgi:hypothetical protein
MPSVLWSYASRGRMNPLVPAVVALVGLIALGIGYRWVGGGVIVGGVLAFFNGSLLSRRVDVAALSGNVGVALMVMQAGLIVTLIVVAVVTVVLIQFSAIMAMSSAAGFAVGQIGSLGVFYWQHGRHVDAGTRGISSHESLSASASHNGEAP